MTGHGLTAAELMEAFILVYPYVCVQNSLQLENKKTSCVQHVASLVEKHFGSLTQ